MAQEFKLPDLGEGVETGDVVRVLVSEGDTISPEQSVIEIETDKAVVEVPCPFGGRISKLHVKQGDKIPVGHLLVTVETDAGAEGTPAEAAPPAVAAEKQAAAPETPAAEPEKPAADKQESAAAAAPPSKPEPADQPERSTPPQPAEPASKATTEELVPAGPATRRLARELGVDLHAVAAMKPGERLTEEDVKAYVKQQMTAPSSTTGGAAAAPPLPDFTQWGEVERVALSSLQRKTAENLTAAWIGPHVTQFDEADISELENLRKRHRDKTGEGGVKLTVTAFAVKAAVVALREFPQFNASFDAARGELVFKRYYHIGVAVDTPAGLVVVMIRDADRKRILDIATEMNDLAERARQRKTTREEMRGSTFTITNLGGIGGTAFTPIVNYPEAAILGLARSRNQPAVENGQLVSRMILPMCLSYDHRVINGADGARFTRRIASLLEDPEMLLLEE